MPTIITIPDAVNVMKALIAERGEDYVYGRAIHDDAGEGCAYADVDGSASCAVGQIAARVLPREEWDRLTTEANGTGVLSAVACGYFETETEEEARALEFLQRAQDSAWPWSKASSVLFALAEGDLDRVIAWGPSGDQPHPKYLAVVLDEEQARARWEGGIRPVTVQQIVDGTVDPLVNQPAFDAA